MTAIRALFTAVIEGDDVDEKMRVVALVGDTCRESHDGYLRTIELFDEIKVSDELPVSSVMHTLRAQQRPSLLCLYIL